MHHSRRKIKFNLNPFLIFACRQSAHGGLLAKAMQVEKLIHIEGSPAMLEMVKSSVSPKTLAPSLFTEIRP